MASLRLVIISLVAALTLVLAPNAAAIVDGKPDFEHDYVVFVGQQVVIPGGPTINTSACSGVLVAPQVVVTAAHCSFLPPGFPAVPPSWVRYAVRTGQAARFTPEAEAFGTIAVHPGFCFGGTCAGGPGGGFTNNDLAVVLIDRPLPGPYANLPKEGFAGKHFDKTKQLVAVGYGFVDPLIAGSFGTRNSVQAEAVVASDAPNFLELPIPSKAKYGTACRVDSGGAALVGNTLVGIHSVGDTSCGGPSYAYRLDTPDARSFLSQYVDLR
jgi:hypothetical protein